MNAPPTAVEPTRPQTEAAGEELTTIEVLVSDTPPLKEVMDRAKMAYLARLMELEGFSIPRVAVRLGCTDTNIRKAIGHLERKYGTDS